jgi:hypothetical protein
MTILQFQSKGPRLPKLVLEELKLQRWYDSLEWKDQTKWYTLHELNAALGIPMARLPTILWRHGWSTQRSRMYGMKVWNGPNGDDDSINLRIP